MLLTTDSQADGMGNPTENSLPRCQIARVGRLVAAIAAEKGLATRCRVWIDPLLCPTDQETKQIALERISDVYRNATSVLVIDASLLQHRAAQLPAAELLLRIYAGSAWMRRLWTLQGKDPPSAPGSNSSFGVSRSLSRATQLT
jgi:hypothetical protein